MIDPLKKVDRLAAAARHETAPSVNVAGRVMAGISRRPAEDDAPLNWIAAAAAAVALIGLVALVPVYSAWSDPVVAMIADLSWGLL